MSIVKNTFFTPSFKLKLKRMLQENPEEDT